MVGCAKSASLFASLKEAREIIEEWRTDYNTNRPHTSLKGLTPTEFAARTKEEGHKAGNLTSGGPKIGPRAQGWKNLTSGGPKIGPRTSAVIQQHDRISIAIQLGNGRRTEGGLLPICGLHCCFLIECPW